MTALSMFWRQLHGELWKLFARPRTYIGFGAFLLVELIFLLLHYMPVVKRFLEKQLENGGYGFEQYFSGLTLAFMVVGWTAFLLGALYLALVAGDVMAKEVEEGTMRMILNRPASRLRVVMVRYTAAVFYTFVLMAFIALSALLIAILKQGTGDMFALNLQSKLYAVYSFPEGLQRYLVAVPLLGLSFTTITSVGFMFSCCNMKPAAASILCLSVMFVDMILHEIPQFENIRHWFLSTHMSAWVDVFQPTIRVLPLVEHYAYIIGADLTFLVIGLLIFQSRDLKS